MNYFSKLFSDIRMLVLGYAILLLEFITPVYYFSEIAPDIKLYGFSDVLTYLNLLLVIVAGVVSRYTVAQTAKPLVAIIGLGLMACLIYSHYFISQWVFRISWTAYGLELGDVILFLTFFFRATHQRPPDKRSVLD